MGPDYLEYYKFYDSHQAIISQDDQSSYTRLRVKHAIALLVGISMAPIFMKFTQISCNSLPKPIVSSFLIISAFGPMVTASYLMRQYYLIPYLEYIYNKYSIGPDSYTSLIDNSS